ncbi:MAG: bifunctional histidinol-phosphatase/imidazoleglycerol-phosphate dehydratase HisB [Lysobacterales bacterium]
MSARRILFVDRDGTLIEEPADQQIDRLGKLALLPDVIPSLLRIIGSGFELVMVSNQDGLGTDAFPREDFDAPQEFLLRLFSSQGIAFREVLIDPHTADDPSGVHTRKPAIGMAMHYVRDRGIDLERSAMVGDRASDMEFAANLGVCGFRLGKSLAWPDIAHALCDAPRVAEIERVTKETRVRVVIDLDRAANPSVASGLDFFDHMLEQLGKHGGFGLTLTCNGDLQIDEHHTVEDCALALGEALRKAVGDKRGIARFANAGAHDEGDGVDDPAHSGSVPIALALPMDDALAAAALDWSGRSYFVFDGAFARERVGDLPTELVPHFFRSLCDAAGINLHLRVCGDNTHHQVEACFKIVGRALRAASQRSGRELPTTKGLL